MRAESRVVRLFLRDLSRRRMLWILTTVVAAVLGYNYLLSEELERALASGKSFAEAQKIARLSFTGVTSAMHTLILPFVAFTSVLMAPESRRSGTTQFLLSVPLPRMRIAVGQFAALAVLLGVAILIAHVGFGYAGWRIGAVSGLELVISWPLLLAAALMEAAAVFALSTALSATATLILVVVVPSLLRVVQLGLDAVRGVDTTSVVRVLEHARFLFPDAGRLVFWPRPWPIYETGEVPATSLLLLFAHEGTTIALWTLLGVFLYLRYDFGSRTLLR